MKKIYSEGESCGNLGVNDFIAFLLEEHRQEQFLKEVEMTLEEKKVRFTVTLDEFDARRLEYVINVLGQVRAIFARNAIMAVVSDIERILGLNYPNDFEYTSLILGNLPIKENVKSLDELLKNSPLKDLKDYYFNSNDDFFSEKAINKLRKIINQLREKEKGEK